MGKRRLQIGSDPDFQPALTIYPTFQPTYIRTYQPTLNPTIITALYMSQPTNISTYNNNKSNCNSKDNNDEIKLKVWQLYLDLIFIGNCF